MERPATWKVLTLGAAMTGLGVLGAGAAMAQPPDAVESDSRSSASSSQSSTWESPDPSDGHGSYGPWESDHPNQTDPDGH